MLQSLLYSSYLYSNLFHFNVFFFLFSIFSLILIYTIQFIYKPATNLIQNFYFYFLKISLVLIFLIFFITNLLFFYIYLFNLINLINFLIFFNKSYFTNFCFFNLIVFTPFIKFTPDLFGLLLNLIAFFVGFVSFFTLDTRVFYKNQKFFILCHLLVFFIFLYTYSNDLLLFFFFYEGLLVPSFLIVYYLSPNRRGIQASLYFLIWTQIGSFLVLIFVFYIYQKYQVYSFSDLRSVKFHKSELWYLYGLVFFGFGFKIPIWPFHYWLTKTHVEAPTGFSIFLSGFLVKSALYGFYKLTTCLGGEINTYFFSSFVFISIIDASLKMWGQSDLKKLVAYGTIQEMNLIYLTFCWGDSVAIYGGFLFCIAHSLLSTLFFYFVDCIYRRYKSRSVVEINGLIHLNPLLGISIFLGCVFYAGLPGTLKFLCEFYIFSGLLETSPISFLILIYSANFIGIIGFSKCWFNAIFGLNTRLQKYRTTDLSSRELLIIGYCFFLLIALNMYLPWWF